MRLNIDCIRAVLLKTEALNYQESLPISTLCKSLPDYDCNELKYTCLKLHEAGLLDCVVKKCIRSYEVVRINDLTYSGHELIANIRNDSVFKQVKAKAIERGIDSIPSIIEIAAALIPSII